MFRSAREALEFAYRTTNTPILKMSSINSMRGPSGFSEMTPHDRHAQAAIILSIIKNAVDPSGIAYLRAQYGAELRGGEHAADVLAALVRVAMASFPTGMHNRRGVGRMIETYFGKGKYSMISLRTDLQCNNRRYYEYKEWVAAAMDRLAMRAEDDAHRALEAAGLILVEVAA